MAGEPVVGEHRVGEGRRDGRVLLEDLDADAAAAEQGDRSIELLQGLRPILIHEYVMANQNCIYVNYHLCYVPNLFLRGAVLRGVLKRVRLRGPGVVPEAGRPDHDDAAERALAARGVDPVRVRHRQSRPLE